MRTKKNSGQFLCPDNFLSGQKGIYHQVEFCPLTPPLSGASPRVVGSSLGQAPSTMLHTEGRTNCFVCDLPIQSHQVLYIYNLLLMLIFVFFCFVNSLLCLFGMGEPFI